MTCAGDWVISGSKRIATGIGFTGASRPPQGYLCLINRWVPRSGIP